jgi:hypothetical protein
MQQPGELRCKSCGMPVVGQHHCPGLGLTLEPLALRRADTIVNAPCPDVGEEPPLGREPRTVIELPSLTVKRGALGSGYIVSIDCGCGFAKVTLQEPHLVALYNALGRELR